MPIERSPLRRCLSLGILLVALCLAWTRVQAQDDPPGRVGRIAALAGEVWAFDTDEGEWQQAVRNRPFVQGDRLSTGADGSAEVQIGSTTLYVAPGTELSAFRLDDDRMQFALTRGSLALRVRVREIAAEIEVLTPEGRFEPQRAGLYRIDRQDETSVGSVWRGDLQFVAADLSQPIGPGERAEFRQEGSPPVTVRRWLVPLADAFAATVQREDQMAERSVSATYVSPEMTGVDDLERHGRWTTSVHYGPVWIPARVPVGWVPYRFGHWAWIWPWGWTWVDDAPWGFAPFHYGRWVWWGGRWGWVPGPRVARPIYAPALVTWIGGPGFGVVIGGRTTPAVGWVPLAPYETFRPYYRTSPRYVDRLNPPRTMRPPPGEGNRHVPGAVTVVPGPMLSPRVPVAPNVRRVDDVALQRQWRSAAAGAEPPARPPRPERDPAVPGMARPAPGSPPPTIGAVAPPRPAPVMPAAPTGTTPTPPRIGTDPSRGGGAGFARPGSAAPDASATVVPAPSDRPPGAGGGFSRPAPQVSDASPVAPVLPSVTQPQAPARQRPHAGETASPSAPDRPAAPVRARPAMPLPDGPGARGTGGLAAPGPAAVAPGATREAGPSETPGRRPTPQASPGAPGSSGSPGLPAAAPVNPAAQPPTRPPAPNGAPGRAFGASPEANPRTAGTADTAVPGARPGADPDPRRRPPEPRSSGRER